MSASIIGWQGAVSPPFSLPGRIPFFTTWSYTLHHFHHLFTAHSSRPFQCAQTLHSLLLPLIHPTLRRLLYPSNRIHSIPTSDYLLTELHSILLFLLVQLAHEHCCLFVSSQVLEQRSALSYLLDKATLQLFRRRLKPCTATQSEQLQDLHHSRGCNITKLQFR